MVEVQYEAEVPQMIAQIFLCHNSAEKRRVSQISAGLSLQHGITHFLDDYSILAGQEFLPAIENALAKAKVCAIFLGAHGWGTTHLWEAEKALERYRRDPTFKIVPVFLPGFDPADADRLGTGTVFQTINGIDLREDDRWDAGLEKLAQVIEDRQSPVAGAARLTPFELRKDSVRWRLENNNSLLYHGRQLEEAKHLLAKNSDLLGVPESEFVLAGVEAQHRARRRRLQWTLSALAALAIATILALVGWRNAEVRGAIALSRQLVFTSRDAPTPDLGLLLAVQAWQTSPTAEAQGNLMEQVQRTDRLVRVDQIGSEIHAIVPMARHLMVGTEAGSLVSERLDEAGHTADIEVGAGGAVTAIWSDSVTGILWLGREDGRVQQLSNNGTSVRDVRPPVGSVGPNGKRINRRILSIVGRPGLRVAVGSADGSIEILNAHSASVAARAGETNGLGVPAMDLDPTAQWLVASTSGTRLSLIDAASGAEVASMPGFDGGILTISFLGRDEIALVTGFGQVVRLSIVEDGFHRLAGFEIGQTSAAAFDPESGRVAVGDGAGNLEVRDVRTGESVLGRLRGHSDRISSLAFSRDRTRLLSGSSDGALEQWRLDRPQPLFKSVPPLPVSADVLAFSDAGDMFAAATEGAAGVWRLARDGWTKAFDMVDASRKLGGDAALAAPRSGADSDGFEPVGLQQVSGVQIDGSGSKVLWLTQAGYLFSGDLATAGMTHLLDRDLSPDGPVAISNDGRMAAAVARGGRTVRLYTLTADPARTEVASPAGVRSIGWNLSGSRLAAGLETGGLILWNLKGQVLASEHPVHGTAIAGLAISRDGRIVSFGAGGGGRDRAVAVTSKDLRQSIRLQSRLAGGSVAALSVSTEQNLIAAADHDGAILLWRLDDLHFVTSLQVGGSYIPAIRLSSQSAGLLVAPSDSDPQRWVVAPERWVQVACARANRYLTESEWDEAMPGYRYDPPCRRP